MAWTRSNPVYPVADVAAAIKWYEEVCGFKATFVHEGAEGPNYAVLYRDAVSGHLVRAAEAQHGLKPPAQAQFWVGDLRGPGQALPGTPRDDSRTRCPAAQACT